MERAKNSDKASLRLRWREMVAEYSELDLTVTSDRLPAIQGCEQQIRERLDESYHFGLWQGQ
jgi:hypothetical protein